MRTRNCVPAVAAVVLAGAFAPSVAKAIEDQTTISVETTNPDGTTSTIQTTRAGVPPAPPPAPEIPRIDERTAFMLGEHKFKIGLLALEYGISKRFSIGTDPPAWALRAFVDVLVPNLHLKVQVLDRDPVWVALMVAGYYGNLSNTDRVSGHLFDIPLTAYVTVKVHSRIYLHGEGAFVFAKVFGTGDATRAELNGSTAMRAAQTGLMAQFRLTRIFSLTALGRFQAWTGDVPFSGTSNPDPFTSASVDGQLVPPIQHPWEIVGGFAVLWKYVHLSAGAGYGYYFVPGMDIPNTKRTFVPDLSLAVIL